MTKKKITETKSVTQDILMGASEMERLLREIYRSDEEKFLLLLGSIKLSNTLKKMKVTHK